MRYLGAGLFATFALGSISACGYLSKATGVVTQKETAPRVVVEVEGVDKEIADNVRAHLSLAQEACSAPDWRVSRLFRRSDEEVRSAVRALGYYSPEISKRLEHPEECWKASYEISLGEPVIVESVEVDLKGEAAGDDAFTSLVEALPIKTGDPVNHARYEEAKQKISSLAAERGYLDGRFVTSELRVDTRQRKAVVRIAYDSGKRYAFGPLSIDQDALQPELVRGFVEYEEGTPYNTNKLVEINRALADSGYFAQVDVRPRTEEPENDRIPVDVKLTSRKPHQFTASAGLSTDTGPRIRLGYENRRLNRRGHRLSTGVSASLIQQDLTAEYRIPLKDPRSEWLSFEGGWRQEDTETSETTAYKLAARQTKKRRADWLETRFIEASQEDFEVGLQRDTTILVTPGISWSRGAAEGKIPAAWGHRIYFEVKGGAESLLSDTSFVRARLRASWLRRLPWGDRVIARGELGAMQADAFEKLPPSQRFFAGGDTSVRGYEYQTLGPKDAAGNVIGGNYLVVGSLEYEHPIVDKWSVALFADAGNAFSDTDSNDGFEFGIGFGVRWYSPIGPVRLDLAHPVDNNPLFRIHLRLGPDI